MADSTDAKSLFLSKTFWLNILGAAVQLSGYVPPKYGVPAQAIANILVRTITSQPVTLP